MLGLQLYLVLSLAHNIVSNISIYGTFEMEDPSMENGLGFEKEWKNFLEKYEKNYDEEETRYRLEIFKNNYAEISAHNKLYKNGKVSYEKEINHFTDMTFEEIKTVYLGFDHKKSKHMIYYNEYVPNHNIDVPSEVDWRTKNVVTPVKNQGDCGSCYSFSATGSMEGQYALKHKTLISLSEQNLIDCSSTYGNNGCGGGLMAQCFDYVKQNKGIDTEKLYPYEAKDGKCRYQSNPFELNDYKYIQTGNENDLMNAVASVGPISIAIDADNDFMSYKNGVFSSASCDPRALNHGVLAVGYGVDNGVDYWLVKNSWGPQWGLKGYIKMARNSNNMCGVATNAVYPIL